MVKTPCKGLHRDHTDSFKRDARLYTRSVDHGSYEEGFWNGSVSVSVCSRGNDMVTDMVVAVDIHHCPYTFSDKDLGHSPSG